MMLRVSVLHSFPVVCLFFWLTGNAQLEKKVTYWPDSSVRSVEYFRNGKSDSVCSHYTSTGRLTETITYSDGLKNGAHTFYNSYGGKFVLMYKNGQRHGRSYETYSDGTLAYEWDYVNDKREGSENRYSDGKIREVLRYHNDTLVEKISYYPGTDFIHYHDLYFPGKLPWSVKYYENGSVAQKIYYNTDSTKYDSVVEFHRNGARSSMARFYFVDSVYNTAYYSWDSTGNLKRSSVGAARENGYYYYITCEYDSSRLYKLSVDSCPVTIMKGSYHFEDDYRGYECYYYPDGALKSYCCTVAGEQHGSFTSWYPDGRQEWRGHYSQYLPTGQWTSYYPDGHAESIQHWRNGEIVLDKYFDAEGHLASEQRKSNGRCYYYASYENGRLMEKTKVVRGPFHWVKVTWYRDDKRLHYRRQRISEYELKNACW